MKRNLFIIAITLSMVVMISACASEEEQLAGSWYNTMDPEEELILTEDGSFSFHNNGGNYSVEGENIILNYGYESEIFYIDSSEDTIYDEYGEAFLNNREQAIAAYEEYCETKTTEEKQQVVGEWVREDEHMIINDDNTYTIYSPETNFYSDNEERIENGTWEIEINGEYTTVIFTITDLNYTPLFTTYKAGAEYDLTVGYDDDKGNYILRSTGADYEKVR